jgi:hypothetical protein
MSRNEIRLDQIEQRLGQINKPRQAQYDEYGYAIPQMHDADDFNHEGDGPTLNAGFIATIVALSLAAGAGTFFFIGGDASMPSFKMGWGGSEEKGVALSGSVMDPVCGKDWQPNLPNTDQLYCYLTRQVYRLCDATEHEALIATIRLYDKEYKVWHRKYMMATFKTIGKMQTQGLQLGMEAAKLENMSGGSEKDQMDQLVKVTEMADNIMKPANQVLEQRVAKVPEYELENAVHSLAKRGYISGKDFGASKPDFVAKALKRAGKVKTACPNRG